MFCSGFETRGLFRKKYADMVSTFACVSEKDIQISQKLNDTLVWDTNDPYLYMRTTDDDRLLVGGEDSPLQLGSVP